MRPTAAGGKATRAGLEVRLDEGFADRLPYPDGSIDRVLSSFMLHHLPAAERLPALREVRRVLARGGSLHVLDLDGTARFGHRAHPHGVGPRGLLDEAGFTDVVEVGRGSSWFGGHRFHRAAG